MPKPDKLSRIFYAQFPGDNLSTIAKKPVNTGFLQIATGEMPMFTGFLFSEIIAIHVHKPVENFHDTLWIMWITSPALAAPQQNTHLLPP